MPADQPLENAVVTSVLDLNTIMSLFITSSEYFAHAGGTNVDFVSRLYRDFLQRPASPKELSGWTKSLDASRDRALVVSGIRNSLEAIDLAVQGIVTQFLRRSANPKEASTFINLFRGGASREKVLSLVLGSPEYLDSVIR